MPFLQSGSTRIHYDVYGGSTGRPPLLLSHGFCASARMWDRNIGALADDRQVLTWDMRGHARSDCPAEPSKYGVEQSIQDMLLLRGVLDVPRVVLGGMSLG